MEGVVTCGPDFVELAVAQRYWCVLQQVMAGEHTGLPVDVSAFDRELQGHRLDSDTCFGQCLDVLDRQLADTESPLRGGDHEALFCQAGQRLPDHRLAQLEPRGQLDKLEPFPRRDTPVQQVLAKGLVDLLGAGTRTSID